MCIESKKDRWLAPSTVAQMIGVSVNTVYCYIEAGRFNRVRNISTGSAPRYQIERESVKRLEAELILPN